MSKTATLASRAVGVITVDGANHRHRIRPSLPDSLPTIVIFSMNGKGRELAMEVGMRRYRPYATSNATSRLGRHRVRYALPALLEMLRTWVSENTTHWRGGDLFPMRRRKKERALWFQRPRYLRVAVSKRDRYLAELFHVLWSFTLMKQRDDLVEKRIRDSEGDPHETLAAFHRTFPEADLPWVSAALFARRLTHGNDRLEFFLALRKTRYLSKGHFRACLRAIRTSDGKGLLARLEGKLENLLSDLSVVRDYRDGFREGRRRRESYIFRVGLGRLKMV